MIAALSELTDIGADFLLIFGLVFLRTGGAMALLPAFGEMMVPARVRLALGLAFAAVVTPAASSGLEAALAAGNPILEVALLEMLAGLVLGFALRILIFVLQVAGTMAAQATSLSQLLGGQGVDPQPALGAILVLAGLALATMAGLHVRLAEMFIISYAALPPGAVIDPAFLAEWGFALADDMFRSAFALAMPFVLASMLYNLALGVINRAMPQLMVAFVGAPAITWGALLLLALAAPAILSVWIALLGGRLADPLGLPR
ncbi:type III secretion protein [Alphaproteobacteria bacterium GH1-50]|uniref:Type III secretion protein n=1 Tax=Kangsaoukella pontilimi TaxID=2691042 RepID=A0A7C9IGP5_9RHOB|nr:flagellar biosynthetic protein FliR [Kangsaoukella pontilimi]MXQ08169.1 type III secretion protein [Kangsaoukella pontilimi]